MAAATDATNLHQTKVCAHCGGAFARKKWMKGAGWTNVKYCSRSCSDAAKRLPCPDLSKPCTECGAEIRLTASRNRAKFEKQRVCSPACASRAAVKGRDPENRVVDMPIGSRWGLWTIVSSAGRGDWHCRCDCGTSSVVNGASLRIGNSGSCGCRVPEISREMGRLTATHGMTGTPEYAAWRSMKGRCHNPTDQGYGNYGARGIIVCDRWRDSFENFLADMGLRPSDNHSIDRINVNGNYEPKNCRWATTGEQSRNRRNNRWVTHQGQAMLLTDAAMAAGLPVSTVQSRMRKGWPEDRWFEARHGL